MHKNSKPFVDNETQFENSLQELRKFSSQLYHSADYWKATFLNAKDKRLVVETTKEYVCGAVVKVVDHLGCISTNLESSFFNGNTVSAETEHKFDTLKQRIMSCQHYSGKLALTRFYRTTHFSRYQCRYISPPLNSEMTSVVLRNTESPIKAKKEFENVESLVSCTIRDCMPCDPFKNSASFMDRKINEFSPTVVAARDGSQSMSSKTKYSYFHFQETAHQKQKGSKINLKNKNIKTLISRGRRILG